MATNPIQSPSRSKRALYASPILILSIVLVKVFAMGEAVAPLIMEAKERSVLEFGGVSVSVLEEFYGIPVLDKVLSNIVVAFAFLQFDLDRFMYLHSLVLLTDWAGMYAIMFFESSRKSNTKTFFFKYPLVILFAGQFVGVGLLAPIYFYFLHVLTPPTKLATLESRSIDRSHAAAVLPTIVLTYMPPNLLSFLHPSLEVRHWWNWVWQIYPVWGSLAFFVITKVTASHSGAAPRQSSNASSILRATAGALVAMSTAVYWYAASTSDWALADMFVPKYFLKAPRDPLMALRTIIQVDYISSFGSALLWLLYCFGDLKAAGVVGKSWAWILLLACGTGIMLGPGSLVMICWIVREEMLGGLDDVERTQKTR